MLVNIKYVNFPRPGGKYGSIKLADGQTIMVPPDLLGLFRAGMTCEIGTKAQTWGLGTDQARQVTVATSGPLPGGAQQGVQQGYAAPTGQAYGQAGNAYRPNTGFRPVVHQGGMGQAPAARPGGASDRMIWLTGIVGRAMGSGKFAASEIAVLAQAAAQAFELVTKPPAPAAQPYGAGGPTPEAHGQYLGEPPLPEDGDPGPGAA